MSLLLASFIVSILDCNDFDINDPVLEIDADSESDTFFFNNPRYCNDPVVSIKFAFALIAPELTEPHVKGLLIFTFCVPLLRIFEPILILLVPVKGRH